MPKLVYNPVDRKPAPPMSHMALRIGALFVMCTGLVGLASILGRFSTEEPRQDWQWQPSNIRANFVRILTFDEAESLLRDGVNRAGLEFGSGSPIEKPPASNSGDRIAPPPIEEAPVPRPLEWSDRDAHEMRLAQAQLTRAVAIDIAAEARTILDFEGFRDDDQTRVMQEFAANRGHQAPPNEKLALQVLHKLPGLADYKARINRNAYYFGRGRAALEQYRGQAFAAEGRLFDLYEVKAEPPYVMPDGKSISSYFEGVVVMLSKGEGFREQQIEQRVVIFHCLGLPDELKKYVNSTGSVSHEDLLSSQAVMVSLTGVFLRAWVYSRPVAPFSTAAKAETSQAFAPLLLTADIAPSGARPYELTDELLQQVRDSLRTEPVYLETEAAYYALLAKANSPDDEVTAVEDVSYFDLAGSRGETGPRYRGQGIRVAGMIGDDYAPVILPPNLSGLRRVFRALVLADTSDVNSPKRYLLDMVEPPTGLEPRALVGFNARYYRNVFETRSTSSQVAPLLIVRKATPLSRAEDGNSWVYAAVTVGGFLFVCVVVAMFVVSDRRERRRFEAATMETARKRLEKRGGFKLKPLPGDRPPDEAGPPPAN